jgi:hypothetical protein
MMRASCAFEATDSAPSQHQTLRVRDSSVWVGLTHARRSKVPWPRRNAAQISAIPLELPSASLFLEAQRPGSIVNPLRPTALLFLNNRRLRSD